MSQSTRPNILLVTTDQQRYDATGLTGPTFLRTPHYDNLAREGILFRRAYADCPICVPSRVSIMTGKTVFAHGMDRNGHTSEVMGRENTLPALLGGLGYQTAAIGKMHFTPERTRHGFDEMILPSDYYRRMHDSGSALQPMRHGLGQNELYATMATVPESQTLTNWTAQQCLEYIRFRRDPGAPFFLWCSFSKPHPPLDPPEPYYSMYRQCDIPRCVTGDWADDSQAPEAFRRFRQQNSYDLLGGEVLREARSAYYGLITQIDYNLGRVLAALQDLGQLQDTLIIYTSDHGEYLGDHHAGSKVFFHDCSARIPMVLRLPQSWPDRCHGRQIDSPVCLADILPTLLAAAGGGETAPADCDGIDLAALARGQRPPRDYLEATARPDAYLAITDGKWKYIYYPEGPFEQLFNLADDPQELRNLAHSTQHAAKRGQLYDELLRRQQRRGNGWVQEGRLKSFPAKIEPLADRRNQAWPGIHSEYYDVDVRH